jgi:hypothetical protein
MSDVGARESACGRCCGLQKFVVIALQSSHSCMRTVREQRERGNTRRSITQLQQVTFSFQVAVGAFSG